MTSPTSFSIVFAQGKYEGMGSKDFILVTRQHFIYSASNLDDFALATEQRFLFSLSNLDSLSL